MNVRVAPPDSLRSLKKTGVAGRDELAEALGGEKISKLTMNKNRKLGNSG